MPNLAGQLEQVTGLLEQELITPEQAGDLLLSGQALQADMAMRQAAANAAVYGTGSIYVSESTTAVPNYRTQNSIPGHWIDDRPPQPGVRIGYSTPEPVPSYGGEVVFDNRVEVADRAYMSSEGISHNHIPLDQLLTTLITKIALIDELKAEIDRLKGLYEAVIDIELEKSTDDDSRTS